MVQAYFSDNLQGFTRNLSKNRVNQDVYPTEFPISPSYTLDPLFQQSHLQVTLCILNH